MMGQFVKHRLPRCWANLYSAGFRASCYSISRAVLFRNRMNHETHLLIILIAASLLQEGESQAARCGGDACGVGIMLEVGAAGGDNQRPKIHSGESYISERNQREGIVYQLVGIGVYAKINYTCRGRDILRNNTTPSKYSYHTSNLDVPK
eukprot:scaffold3597_cov86-Skeletonema_dohrnii-CCMP3373.AAC.2